jgi:dihydroneopterin aldolase
MPRLQFERRSFLEGIEVELVIDQPAGAGPRETRDPGRKPERVSFDVELSWRSPGTVETEDGADGVVSHAQVYEFIRSLAGTVQRGPLESILDKVCEIALVDPRVDEVKARLSRLDVAAPGRIGIAVRKQTLRNRF